MVLISPVIQSTVETRFPLPLFKSVTVLFIPPVADNQRVSFARIFAQVIRTPFQGSSIFSGSVEVFFNNNLVASDFLGPGENFFEIDVEIPIAAIKKNETNAITIEVEQALDISTTWQLFADFFYQVVDRITGVEEEPPEEPTIEGPPIEMDDSIKFNGILDFLFGDVEKTTRTIVVVGAVIAAIVLIPPIVRLVRG